MHLIEITKTKVLVPRACLTLAVVVYPVLVFFVTNTLNNLIFQSVYFERTWWRLFQKQSCTLNVMSNFLILSSLAYSICGEADCDKFLGLFALYLYAIHIWGASSTPLFTSMSRWVLTALLVRSQRCRVVVMLSIIKISKVTIQTRPVGCHTSGVLASCCSICSLLYSVLYMIACPFVVFFCHRMFCPSTYGFWFPLWHY